MIIQDDQKDRVGKCPMVEFVNKYGFIEHLFNLFINKLLIINQIKSHESPVNSYYFPSLFPLFLNAYKPGYLSCIYTSTGIRLSSLTNHQIYSDQISQWIWAPSDMLRILFQCILMLPNEFWTPQSPQRF